MQQTETISAVRSGSVGDYVELLRPMQWVKNVVVFAGPAAAKVLTTPRSFGLACIAFVAFCIGASGVYAINDVIDRRADATHPTKRDRPVARGAIRPGTAVVLALVLIAVALGLSAGLLNLRVTVILAMYLAMVIAYSLALKQRVILDVIVIATGFVLRAWAGAEAVGVDTSDWLIACMFTLCMFLGFGKRRCELAMLKGGDAGLHRRTLVRYTPELLNHLITVSAGIAVVTFLLYTLDPRHGPVPIPKEQLFYTLPIVMYGVFRYAMVTELGVYTGPTEIVVKDRPLLGAIVVWAIAALVIVYQENLFGAGGLQRLPGAGR